MSQCLHHNLGDLVGVLDCILEFKLRVKHFVKTGSLFSLKWDLCGKLFNIYSKLASGEDTNEVDFLLLVHCGDLFKRCGKAIMTVVKHLCSQSQRLFAAVCALRQKRLESEVGVRRVHAKRSSFTRLSWQRFFQVV
jgi:hypothetical protein